jgi:hypothetical protein
MAGSKPRYHLGMSKQDGGSPALTRLHHPIANQSCLVVEEEVATSGLWQIRPPSFRVPPFQNRKFAAGMFLPVGTLFEEL